MVKYRLEILACQSTRTESTRTSARRLRISLTARALSLPHPFVKRRPSSFPSLGRSHIFSDRHPYHASRIAHVFPCPVDTWRWRTSPHETTRPCTMTDNDSDPDDSHSLAAATLINFPLSTTPSTSRHPQHLPWKPALRICGSRGAVQAQLESDESLEIGAFEKASPMRMQDGALKFFSAPDLISTAWCSARGIVGIMERLSLLSL